VEEYPDEQMYEDCLYLSEQAGLLAGHMWAYNKEHGLDKLP
jgi:hypothetical protein